MSANGVLDFQSTNKLIFRGTNSNVVIDTRNLSLGVGTDGNGAPASNLYVTGNAYVSSNLEVGTGNLFVDTITSNVGIGTNAPLDTLHINGGTRFAGHIIPTTNATFDVGSAENKVRDLYVDTNSLWIGDLTKIAFERGKMKFKRRKVDKVPRMLVDLAIQHGRTNESDVETHAIAFAQTKDSSISSVSDLKLQHWRDYAKTFDETKAVSDIFVDNDEDYEAVTASEAFIEVGSNIFTEHSLSIGKTTDPTSTLDVVGTIKATALSVGEQSSEQTITQNYNSLTNIPASSRASGTWRSHTFGNITLPANWSNNNFQFKVTVNGNLNGVAHAEYVTITMKKQGSGTQPSVGLNFNPQNQSSGISSSGGRVYYTNVVVTNSTVSNGSFSAGDVVDIYMSIYVTYWYQLSLAVEIRGGGSANILLVDETNSRVGVGLDQPTTALDVNGTVKATAFEGDGSALTGITSGQWTESGGDIYRSSGNVGVGITSPDYKLHAYTNTTGSNIMELEHDGTTTSGGPSGTNHWMQFRYGGRVGMTIKAPDNSVNTPVTFATGNAFKFMVDSTEPLTIDYLGNVGINKTSPDRNFHVVGTSRFDGEVEWYKVGQNTSHANYGSNRDWYIRSGSTAGKIVIQDSGGTVSIGTSDTTTEKLALRGNLDFTPIYGAQGNANRSGMIIFNKPSAESVDTSTNIDSIYFDDSQNAYHFTQDSAKYATGNAGIYCGSIYCGNTLYIGGSTSRGIRSVTGNYGTVQTTGGGAGNWEGYSIDGRYVFMSADNNSCGIYNDLDNEWMIYCYRNSYTRLYFNGSTKAETRNGDLMTYGLYSNGTSRLGAGSQMIYMGGNRSNYFMRFNDDCGFWDPQNGEIHTTNGSGNRYGRFRGTWYSGSSREYKKDITPLSDDEILTMYNDTISTNLYSFYMKTDTPGNDKRKLGVILEESPEYLSPTIDGKGLDSTHWITMLHGATKIIDKNVKTVMNDMQNHLNFTGQHRTLISEVPLTQYENYEGMIVSANNDAYYNDNITINEALPIVSLSNNVRDKSCFGVVSLKEDPNNYEYTAYIPREDGDIRIRVNSLGEGGIWVSNMNGSLESGDYITTSSIPGYGMKQESEFLANYTVAKITMNCNFTKITAPRKRIKRELRDVTYYIQDIENVVEKDLYDRWDSTRRSIKEKDCYAKTFVSTFDTPQDGGWTEYSKDEQATTITKDEYDALEDSKKPEYKEVYRKTLTRTITPHAWSQGNEEYKSQYTKTTSQFFIIMTHKETKTEPLEGYNYTSETRSEMVNVLDEHGQIQWEDTDEVEPTYNIRYLLPDGTQISEEDYTTKLSANEEVYISAFVGCTYHCG